MDETAQDQPRTERERVGCPFCGAPNPVLNPTDAAPGMHALRDRGPYYLSCEGCGADGPAYAELARLRSEVERKDAALNTPQINDFAAGVVSEAQHQRARWSSDHDEGKSPFDWFWLIGYLAQKAATAAQAADLDKAKHHTISTAAALANWHAQLNGDSHAMRPGIEPPARAALQPKEPQ